MSKKEEKKDEKVAKEPATPEQEAAAAKKKKLIIFAVLGLLVIGGGAFAAIKMLGSSTKTKEANATESKGEQGSADGEEGDASGHADGEASGSADGGAHGENAKKGDAHQETKDGGGQGEKKEGSAKSADEHGDKKGSGDHGESGSDNAGKGAGTEGDDSRYAGIGIMYDFKPFHLNLGNPLENRYVRMEIRIEYPNEEQKAELTARDGQMRDAIVSIISRKTREHLLSPDGKDQLRLEIKNRLNQYLEKKIVNVYITDILIE
jgi:flagellar FliL protein